MNGLNLQASVTNVTQMERHQHDTHRTPGINQEQNAEIARNASAQRAVKATAPDETEGKKVESRDRKKDFDKRKKKRSSKPPKPDSGKSTDSGYFLDVQA